MKYLCSLVILCIFIWSANQVIALSYKDTILSTEEMSIINNKYKQEALLLETHVIRFTQKIHEQELEYNIVASKKIQNSYKDLLLMKNRLIEIQNGAFNSQQAQEIMTSIVIDLKIINSTIKKLFYNLELERSEKLRIKKVYYTTFTQNYKAGISQFIDKITIIFLKKDSLSRNERNIVRKLVELREENKKLIDFPNILFNSEEDMQSYLKETILTIQSIIFKIVELSR